MSDHESALSDSDATAPVESVADVTGVAPAGQASLRSDTRMSAAAQLIFRIHDADDRPLADVRIDVRSELSDARSVVLSGSTGRGGEEVFGNLAPGTYSYSLKAADRPLLAGAEFVELQSGESRTLVLRLPDFDRSIHGRVLDRAGRPVAGLAVGANPAPMAADAGARSDIAAMRPAPVTTDEFGGFEVFDLSEGDYLISTPATQRFAAATIRARAGDDNIVLTVLERGDYRLIGTVTDQSGAPLAGAQVLPIGHSGEAARTDSQGRFELPLVPRSLEATHIVSFRQSGYVEHRLRLSGREIVDASPLRRDIALQETAGMVELPGSLSDTRGMPVEGAVLLLATADDRSRFQASTDSQGRFRFRSLPAREDYRLSVAAIAGYRDLVLEGLDLRMSPPPMDLILEPLATGTIHGSMRTPEGQPVTNYRMQLRNTQALAYELIVESDAGGYFEIQDVPAGQVTFATTSSPSLAVDAFELQPGQDASVELVLDVGQRVLTGQVYDANGNVAAGARVELSAAIDGPLPSLSRRTSVTDRLGQFRIEGLAAAPRRLTVAKAGHPTVIMNLTGQESQVEIRLQSPRVAPVE